MSAQTVPIAFLDTETTSTRPDREVWEVGILLRPAHAEPGDEWEHHAFLPVKLQEADRFALNVGGFYERHPYGRFLAGVEAECPEKWEPWTGDDTEMWRDIGRLLHGAIIVGAVPSFDADAIAEPLREADVLPAHDYHLVDVGTLAAGFLTGQGKPLPPLPWKSGDIAEWLGVEQTPEAERHTALGDAKFAMRIYDHVAGGGA